MNTFKRLIAIFIVIVMTLACFSLTACTSEAENYDNFKYEYRSFDNKISINLYITLNEKQIGKTIKKIEVYYDLYQDNNKLTNDFITFYASYKIKKSEELYYYKSINYEPLENLTPVTLENVRVKIIYESQDFNYIILLTIGCSLLLLSILATIITAIYKSKKHIK